VKENRKGLRETHRSKQRLLIGRWLFRLVQEIKVKSVPKGVKFTNSGSRVLRELTK
jgi:hypothetical protein